MIETLAHFVRERVPERYVLAVFDSAPANGMNPVLCMQKEVRVQGTHTTVVLV